MISQYIGVSNDEWWQEAQDLLPGGVNAASRLNKVLGQPLIVSRGEGGVIVDHRGHQYIDMNMSSGATLLGYKHPAICAALNQAVQEGILCGHEMLHQIALAREVARLIPGIDMVRFGNSGTETTWHAVRLARAYTGKSIVVKFEGHFHGYNDYLGYSTRPPFEAIGPLTAPIPYPDTIGMPEAMRDNIIVLPFNNLEVTETLLKQRHSEIAAIIMEPVNYNSGTILPIPGYLEGVRRLTHRYNIVLIFDEILSGFRTGPGCIQDYFQTIPDITVLGKALGGGLPLSVLGGKREIMQQLAPAGKLAHSGTYNAHPASILTASAFLQEIQESSFYPNLLSRCQHLYQGLRDIFRLSNIPVKVQALGARFSLLFGISEEQNIQHYRDLAQHNDQLARYFYRLALEEGLYFHPRWHHGISAAHTDEQIEQVLRSVELIARKLKEGL